MSPGISSCRTMRHLRCVVLRFTYTSTFCNKKKKKNYKIISVNNKLLLLSLLNNNMIINVSSFRTDCDWCDGFVFGRRCRPPSSAAVFGRRFRPQSISAAVTNGLASLHRSIVLGSEGVCRPRLGFVSARRHRVDDTRRAIPTARL